MMSAAHHRSSRLIGAGPGRKQPTRCDPCQSFPLNASKFECRFRPSDVMQQSCGRPGFGQHPVSAGKPSPAVTPADAICSGVLGSWRPEKFKSYQLISARRSFDGTAPTSESRKFDCLRRQPAANLRPRPCAFRRRVDVFVLAGRSRFARVQRPRRGRGPRRRGAGYGTVRPGRRFSDPSRDRGPSGRPCRSCPRLARSVPSRRGSRVSTA